MRPGRKWNGPRGRGRGGIRHRTDFVLLLPLSFFKEDEAASPRAPPHLPQPQFLGLIDAGEKIFKGAGILWEKGKKWKEGK